MIADAPLRQTDSQTGATITIYESVLNLARQEATEYDKMRAFVAPLGVIKNDEPLVVLGKPDGKTSRYNLTLLCFHDRMDEQAMRALTKKYQQKSMGKFTADRSNVSRLNHQQVEFALPDFPNARVDPIGRLDADLAFSTTEPITVTVPDKDAKQFEALYKSGRLVLDMFISYRSKDIQQASFGWTEDDIRKTSAFKTLSSGGGAFVDANQVESVIREVITVKNASVYRDPGVPAEIAEQAKAIFTKLLEAQPEQTNASVAEKAHAAEIERKLLAGTRLTAEQFKPITVMWEVLEDLNEVTDVKTANEKLQAYFNKDTNRNTISASAGVGFGPFSAKAGYEKEMTQENVKNGYFKDIGEFNDFRKKHTTMKGLRPVITPRGLNLVERQTFVSNVGLAVSAVGYYPRNQRQTLHIRTSGLRHQNQAGGFPYGLIEQVPIGGVLPYAGHTAPEGWLVCDGHEYDLRDFPQYLPLAERLGGKFYDRDRKTLRLPDLRGRGVIGAGQGSGLTTRVVGDSGGSETHTLTVPQLPAHSHEVDDKGHDHDLPPYPGREPDIYARGNQNQAATYHTVIQPMKSLPRQTGIKIKNTGDGKPHPVMDPFLVLNYLIKY